MLKSVADSIKKTIDETYQADFEHFLDWLEKLPETLREKYKPIHARLETLASDHPAKLALYFALAAFIVVFPFSLYFWITEFRDFGKNVLVEAHGMVMDLLIIVFLYSWFQSRGERKLRIRRYLEEIEDYLPWKSEEAGYRIAGLIKRLNKERHNQPLILFGAFLQNTNLVGANLQKARLSGANLQDAALSYANLQAANLQGADLRHAQNLLNNPTLLIVKTLHLAELDPEVTEFIKQSGRQDLFDPPKNKPGETATNSPSEPPDFPDDDTP